MQSLHRVSVVQDAGLQKSGSESASHAGVRHGLSLAGSSSKGAQVVLWCPL